MPRSPSLPEEATIEVAARAPLRTVSTNDLLCRFIPIVRTFAPLVAGVGAMNYRTFLTYSVIGGTLWIWSMLLIGYFLGTYVPGIEHHIEKVIIVVIFISILPGIIGALKERRAAKAARAA